MKTGLTKLIVMASLLVPNTAFALDRINSTGPGHLAIRGHDTTSYFLSSRPKPGQGQFVVEWKGAKWRFANQKDADTFKANPSAYAPQFGAYCTGGLSQRHVVEGKPSHWRIHKKKLYLFHTRAGAQRFSGDPEGTIRRAKAYWNTLNITD